MKALLICGSLLVNAALVAALVERPTLAPPALRALFSHPTSATAIASAAPKPDQAPTPAKLWSRLDSTDLRALVANLRAAGFPPNVLRTIIAALIEAQFSSQTRALSAAEAATPFWKLKPRFMSTDDPRLLEMQRLGRERTRLARELMAALPPDDSDVSSYQRTQFGNLSPAKIDMVQRIQDDYAEMISSIRAGMNGIELPEDREKLALLAKEKHADLAAVLSPDELAEYERRNSPLTMILRNQLTALDASEQEYQAIFSAYQQLGQKYQSGTALGMDPQLRADAQATLAGLLKTGLGDARYNQFLLTSSSDYTQLSRMAQQQNLPGDAVTQAIALRDSVVQQSQQIAGNTDASVEERRTALQSLAANARQQLANLMPGDATQAYLKRASWITPLDHGMAISITPTPPVVFTDVSGNTMSFGSGSEVRLVPLKRGTH